jgi:quinol monooxygenase YgiN
VRLAELEIDFAQLENYRAALKEKIEAFIRSEPGVLTLHAVCIRDNLTQIRLFEMDAYNAHLKTPHFQKVIPIQTVNAAYDRLLKFDVKYRFSIDLESIARSALQ